MKQWFVVHTHPFKERVAAQHLQAQGFETYAPCFKKSRRHARKVDIVTSPLFPRYIFVGMDPSLTEWRKINNTRGVSYLLMWNDRPASIPSKIIDYLKAQENTDGFVPLSSLSNFSKGAKVRILEGAFKDHIAIFEKFDDKQRVQLLLNFLGQEVSISLPTYAAEAA